MPVHQIMKFQGYNVKNLALDFGDSPEMNTFKITLHNYYDKQNFINTLVPE